MNTKYFLLIFVVSLAGCASAPTGPQYAQVPIKQEFATVYIYRPYHKVASLVAPEVFLDNRPIVHLSSRGYAVMYARPGKRTISAKGSEMTVPKWSDPIKIEIEPGKQYFIGLITTADEGFSQGVTAAGNVYSSPAARNIKHRWVLSATEAEAFSYGIGELRLIGDEVRSID